ncbi:MAG: AMP-binding protein [Actinomycetota bacterium]|nr:AMP-binding protein [Actinomycetota bacterium]
MLRDAAAQAPDRLALVEGIPDAGARRRWTYAELLDDSERVARALLARFEPGERVAVWANNIPEWELLELGAGLAGIVLVTVNPAYRASELSYVLRQSRASGLFLVPEVRGNPMLRWLDDVRPDLPELHEVIRLDQWDDFRAGGSPDTALPAVAPDDPAQIQYTSGTTGFPKGAHLHHRGIANNARFTATLLEMSDADAWVNPAPMFHTAGCVAGALCPLSMRATHVLVETFDPALVLELCESERGTVLFGVPTMLIAVLEHPDVATRDLSALEKVISGGATVPAELVRRIESILGVRFTIVYGQTEASPVMTQVPLDASAEDKAETIGVAHPCQEIAILSPETGEPVPFGEIGEICGRGYNVMLEYFEMPERTAETIDADRWLHTGDLGTMDDRGYLRIEGRLKDMIIRGGENIYPREIEELLFTHPDVADVAVVGVPDDRWGEEVAAVVRRLPGTEIDETALRSFVRDRLAAYKAPRRWAFVDELPLTPSGKIQKYVLREQLEKGELTPNADA